MFNEIQRVREQRLEDTFKKVSISGKDFIAVNYDGRNIGLVNSEKVCELHSPFMDDEPTWGILNDTKHALQPTRIPDAVKDIVMYIRVLMGAL